MYEILKEIGLQSLQELFLHDDINVRFQRLSD